MELIISLRKYRKLEYVMNNHRIFVTFVTESKIRNLLIYGDKVASFLYQKKGDLRLATNNRGISLTPSAAKIYNKLLFHRIRPVLENILRDNQNAFREKRSTATQRIIEGVIQKQLPSVIIFLDFSKAFDSIDRPKIEQILEAHHILIEIIKTIMIMYKNTQALRR